MRGAKKGFGGGARGRGNDEPREMHDAICSSCGKECQVPFKPSGKTPVLCKDCFAKSRGDEPVRERRGEHGDRGERGDRGDRREKPRFDTRTSYKDGRESRGTVHYDPRVAELEIALKEANEKLDRILDLIGGMALGGAITDILKKK